MLDQTMGSPENKGNLEALAQPQEQANKNKVASSDARKAAAEELLGYTTCPGQAQHTGKNGPQDCRIKIDGVPTLSCVHASCAEEVKTANQALRKALGSSGLELSVASGKKAAALAKARARFEEELKVRTKKSWPRLLEAYRWPYDQIIADSPLAIDLDDDKAMFRAFLGLFEGEDVIWIGNVTDTGRPENAANFKSKALWVAEEKPLGSYTCPSCFVPGSVSRSKESVSRQRYLVVESDSLSKDEVGAVFRWLDQAVELPLRAVVDTAGKSLHGWFEYPTPEVLAELKIVLPVMGCDPKMFGSSQPCRLPGGLREGRVQKLIYAKNGGAQ
jgi:hypothetical protein